LREEGCFAAQLLRECGLNVETLRTELAQPPAVSPKPKEAPLLSPIRSNLTLAAGQLNPFVARNHEMERIIQVLGRSRKNSVALVGPPGAGKRAMVEGLAKRIAEDDVPPFLADSKVLDFDVVQLLGPRGEHAREILRFGKPHLFFMEELISQLISSVASAHPLASEGIKALLLEGKFQCLCSASADDYERAINTHPWLESCFSVVEIPPMTDDEATQVLISAQKRLEQFHGLTINYDVMMDAVRYSAAFILNRALPEKALDLVDEAAAHARARQRTNVSDQTRELRKRIRAILKELEVRGNAEEMQRLTEQERTVRKELNSQLEKHKQKSGVAIELTRRDVEEVVSQWTGIPLEQIQKGPAPKAKRTRRN
jgi:ATP-dependent Clp protease ATP-binding subunit ClpC